MDAESVYTFRHALLRDGAYDLQLPTERARLHGLALALIEQVFGAPPPDDTGTRPSPAPVDAVALELAGHAAMARSDPTLDPASAARLRSAHLSYLLRAGYAARRQFRLGEAADVFDRLARAAADNLALKRLAVHESADCLRLAGQPRHALAGFLHALNLAVELGDRDARIAALIGQAAARLAAGQLEGLEDLYEQVLGLARSHCSAVWECRALGNRSQLWDRQGNLQRAIQDCAESLRIARELGNVELIGKQLSNLGNFLADAGRQIEALPLYDEALSLARGNLREEMVVKLGTGAMWMDIGDIAKAKPFLVSALELAERCGEHRMRSMALGNYASLLLNEGNSKEARAYVLRAIELDRETGDLVAEGFHTGNLADGYLQDGEPERAMEAYEQSVSLCRRAGHRPYELNWRAHLAVCLALLGRREEALNTWNDAVQGLRECGHLAAIERNADVMRLRLGAVGMEPLPLP
ncbi:MAG: tetratricopeptide repeat protein [Planctomycetes bacterium]|jgi:tetratricopeptide (TPR) repeat protein|nr:tetratricopeptide repeat protein [Planctomycetota bacterium]MCL4729242.1 tetratricopeptide repeat protein [Planctomycetota bacterium]